MLIFEHESLESHESFILSWFLNTNLSNLTNLSF